MTERTARIPAEHPFSTHDGDALAYRHWPVTGARRRGAIVLFQRGHESDARMAHLVDELGLPDFDFFAWDGRGHRADLPSAVRDVQTFIDHIGAAHGVPERHLHLVAQGAGAVLIATWAHDHAPKVRGLTLVAPAFRLQRRWPFAHAGLETTASRHALDAAAERVVADASAITLPVQLLIAGADAVAQARPQHSFFARLGSAIKTKMELPGVAHDALGERERAPVVAAVRGFILERFDAPAAPVDLREAHLAGPSAEAARALARPLSTWSLRGACWALARAGLRFRGRFSRGLKLGQEAGFDAAGTLDHIYRNTPEGQGALGRAIDRRFLDSIDARGIRQRKLHIEELIREAMERLAEQHREVRVMDIAAGHGRHVLDAVRASPVKTSTILLRDPDERNVRAGSALIVEKELQDIAKFVQADAFDRFSLASVTPRPTLAVVSGLCERFPDNEIVRRSLAGVGDAVEDRGYLVYTAQPWHPQPERIARVFTGAPRSDARVMRRRTQAEMDQLVEEAGFRKIAQRVDAWGIFTVSLAIRTGH